MRDVRERTEHGQDSNGLRISRIGPDLMITGNVAAKGAIQLDGQVHGEVHCVSLVLGEGSQLEGGVIAEDVVLRGRLIGSVRALRVTLQSKCHVEGELVHQSLAIEKGAFFEGESRRTDDPLSPSQETSAGAATAKPRLVAERSKKLTRSF